MSSCTDIPFLLPVHILMRIHPKNFPRGGARSLTQEGNIPKAKALSASTGILSRCFCLLPGSLSFSSTSLCLYVTEGEGDQRRQNWVWIKGAASINVGFNIKTWRPIGQKCTGKDLKTANTFQNNSKTIRFTLIKDTSYIKMPGFLCQLGLDWFFFFFS